ncbi:MAG: hypothetical protein IJ222_05840 [Bacteroidales bacterium]|nr:hypothetical protein [Bacteroidales bacterium]
MKQLNIISTILSVMMLACSCQEESLSQSFVEYGNLRIEIKGFTTFLYDPLSCQVSFNRDKCEFRVHSDNMSDFYSLTLDEFPSEAGMKVSGTVSWTTGNNLHNKKTTFEVLKLEGDKVWLWSSKNRIALVVRSLE